MLSDETFSELLIALYDGAIAPASWTRFLERLATVIRGEGTVLLSHKIPGFSSHFNGFVRFDPQAASLYEQKYAPLDIRIQAARADRSLGPVMRTPLQICSEDQLQRSSFYEEFMQPNHIYHDVVGLFASTGGVTALVSMRSQSKGPFGEADAVLIRRLLPHLEQAWKLQSHLADLHSRIEDATNALDAWQIGWILAEADGRIRLANRAALTILNRCEGLHLSGHRISAELTSEKHQLRAYVTSAATERAFLASILISRARKPPLSLLITSSGTNSGSWPARPGAAIFVTAPEWVPPRAFEQIIRQLYGLTGAEARMALELIRGKDPRGAAEALSITFNTARDYVKHIFNKTGVRRQADLVRLLLGSAGHLDPPFEG